MVSFLCECGAGFEVDDRFAGKLGRCPKCRQAVRIPGGETATPPANQQQPMFMQGNTEIHPPPAPRSEDSLGHASQPPALPGSHAVPAAPEDEMASLAAAVDAAEGEAGHRSAGAAAQRWPRSSSRGNVPFIVAGSLILLTFFVPWFIGSTPTFALGSTQGRSPVLMSWDVLSEGPGGLVAFLITAWCVGLSAVIAGFCARGLTLAIWNASHGFIGVAFLIVLLSTSSSTSGIPKVLMGRTALLVVWAIAFLMLLPVTHVRRQIGRAPAIRGLQGAIAGILSMLTAIGLLMVVTDFVELPKALREAFIVDLLMSIVVHLLALAGGVLALIDAARPKCPSRVLADVSLGLLLGLILLMAFYVVIRPATMDGIPGGVSLFLLNFVVLICGPLFFLLLAGGGRIIVESVRIHRRDAKPAKLEVAIPRTESTPPAERAPESGVRQRLAQLEKLYVDGLVGKQEFLDRRQSILDSI